MGRLIKALFGFSCVLALGRIEIFAVFHYSVLITCIYITKTRLFKDIKNHHQTTVNFQVKKKL